MCHWLCQCKARRGVTNTGESQCHTVNALRPGAGGRVGFQHAVAQPHDAVGAGGDVGLVRDHDDRSAGAVERFQQVHDLVAGGRVEVAGRLVGEDDVGIVDQGPGDGDALLLPAGKLRRGDGQAIGQSDQPASRRQRFVAAGHVAGC